MNCFFVFAKSKTLRKNVTCWLLYSLEFLIRLSAALGLFFYLLIKSMVYVLSNGESINSTLFYVVIAVFFLLLFIIIIPMERQNILQKIIMNNSSENADI
jgi:hypothetical protein